MSLKTLLRWLAPTVALLLGFADLWRGGITLGPIALIIAYCYHFVAGLRHLVWDTGRGLERAQSQRSAWLVVLGSIALMLVLGWYAFAGARAP